MKKLLLTFIFAALCGTVCKAQTSTSGYDWTKVIDALIKVESNGNPKARNGKCLGCLQITPICVKQINILLGRKAYTLEDRLDVNKSREMFVVYQEHYNKKNSIEKAIRSWKGGRGYTKQGTERYYQKVMREYKKGDSK